MTKGESNAYEQTIDIGDTGDSDNDNKHLERRIGVRPGGLIVAHHIDVHWSADAPFGVFADPEPSITETIIGGEDLVGVDWVGGDQNGP